ncbi:MAG TPA: DUF1292 domain-containing protein [Candidatus Pelethocola excrementipullorum]|nr:DUF1292 domain-containing protein [Candidatus Pelethocola excrementipullorum]
MSEDLLVLTDENGEELQFEVLDIMEHKGEEYIVLFPEDGDEDEPVHILRVTSEDLDSGEEQYEGLDDRELIETLYQQFCKRNGL